MYSYYRYDPSTGYSWKFDPDEEEDDDETYHYAREKKRKRRRILDNRRLGER